MPDYQNFYREFPEQYDELVRAEDCEGNLREHLAALIGPKSAVVEIGAGTGRLTRLLTELGVASIVATEIQPAMIEIARQRQPASESKVHFAVADARSLPAASRCADLVIAGWVLGHFRSWEEDWRAQIDLALEEFLRVCKRDGRVVIIETLGTNQRVAGPPTVGLAEYYQRLESRGFVRAELSTDYKFESLVDAARITGAFFGEDMGQAVLDAGNPRVPEWTGVWTLDLSG